MERKNTVILARVSSKAQEDEGYSLDSQLKLLRSYCEKNDLKIVRIFKIAETASKAQSRKVFNEMLTYIETNGIYHLTVEKTDRFTRNLRDAVTIDDWLNANDERRLHCVKESLVLHKNARSDVKFMWSIHLSVAKKYTDNLREEAMKGWAEKLAQGWIPSVPPPGYMTVTESGKRIHVPDPETAPLIKKIFDMYLEPSHSISTITEAMGKMGIRTRQGRPYVKSHVQKILNNPFYIGINNFNGKTYPGAQQQFISKEVFSLVQQKMHKGRPAIYKKHNPIFKNLVICDSCKNMVTWQKQKSHYYGTCQRSTDKCKGRKLIREDRLEAQISALLSKLVCPSEAIIQWVAAEMRNKEQDVIDTRDRLVASLQTQIDRINRMDDSLYEDKLSGEISSDKYKTKHEEFMAQKEGLASQLDSIDMSVGSRLEHRLVLLELTQKAAEIFKTRTTEQKRLIITKLFSKLYYEGDAVSVEYTEFAKIIAEKVQETRILMGGK